MRQRVMIAMAIANDPDVIIADEPTTALDVTIQAQVLDVLRTAQHETGAAVIMITHDLGVVAGIADRVLVMYAGRAGRDRLGRRHLLPAAHALHDRAARLGAAARPGREVVAGAGGGQPTVAASTCRRAARSRRAARWRSTPAALAEPRARCPPTAPTTSPRASAATWSPPATSPTPTSTPCPPVHTNADRRRAA